MKDSILLLFLFAFTVHNLEEAVWLTRQSSVTGKVKMHKVVSQDQFLFGLFWVTGLAYLITALYMFYPTNEMLKYAYFGFVGGMILNIVFPHLISTIIERCYSPGLFTGILVIIPINSLIIKTGVDTNTITVVQFINSTLVVGALIMASIPLSFKLGKKLITY
ncbi:HXXEE domain-containing protein [Bacillus thuringiensis]|uniref:HXXEE domain-containing protein n=1 Tax=Bacillus thuringiensis TaxID=1428 RepID=UPI001FB6F974|nr:HXXEE domain-containing protein [Bacillus thuringiensis]